MEDAQDVKYIDAESYTGQQESKLTFRFIVLTQLSRLTQKMTQEWRGGYWTEKLKVITGGLTTTERTYIPDTRDEFVNGVNCLHDILISYFDKQMTEDFKDFESRIANHKKEHEQKDKKVTETYKNEQVEVYRYLFRALNRLLYRLHYLEAKTFEEEA